MTESEIREIAMEILKKSGKRGRKTSRYRQLVEEHFSQQESMVHAVKKYLSNETAEPVTFRVEFSDEVVTCQNQLTLHELLRNLRDGEAAVIYLGDQGIRLCEVRCMEHNGGFPYLRVYRTENDALFISDALKSACEALNLARAEALKESRYD